MNEHKTTHRCKGSLAANVTIRYVAPQSAEECGKWFYEYLNYYTHYIGTIQYCPFCGEKLSLEQIK